ncbi:MAG: hypothetical protein AAF649_02120 [Verrucomicrobiota bacterium]
MDRQKWALIAAIFSAIYLIYPSAGIFEIIPDAIPGIGSLDEATFTALLIWAISVLRGKEVNIKGALFGEKNTDPVEDAKPAQKPDEE